MPTSRTRVGIGLEEIIIICKGGERRGKKKEERRLRDSVSLWVGVWDFCRRLNRIK
jgi:hypothetical protein